MIAHSDWCPESTPIFELHNSYDSGVDCIWDTGDYDKCKECWENSGIEIEIAGEEIDEPNINQEDIVDYINAMSNLPKDVIDIILGLEMDYLKLRGIAEERSND